MIRTCSKVSAAILVALVTMSTGLVSTGAQAHSQDSADMRAHTRVVIAPKVARQLERDGVNIRAYGGAFAYLHAGSAAVHFPITGRSGGVIRHQGTVALREDGRRVSLRNLHVNTNRGLVSAVVNGQARAVVLRWTPSDSQLGSERLVLTRPGARALNRALDRRFLRGDKFAFANVGS